LLLTLRHELDCDGLIADILDPKLSVLEVPALRECAFLKMRYALSNGGGGRPERKDQEEHR